MLYAVAEALARGAFGSRVPGSHLLVTSMSCFVLIECQPVAGCGGYVSVTSAHGKLRQGGFPFNRQFHL